MRRLTALSALLALSLTACASNVLFVTSRDGHEPWTRSVLDAYEETLREASPERPGVEVYPMQVHTVETQQAREALAGRARTKVLNSPAKVVVCHDEFATRELAARLKRTPIRFVASGMRGHPAEYGLTRRENVYGVWAPPDLDGAMQLVRQAVPDARRLGVLADGSPAAWAALTELRRRDDWPMEIAVVHVAQTREAWLDALAGMRHRADAVLCLGMTDLADATGRRVSEREIARTTGRESPLPTVGLTRESVMDGGLLLAIGPAPHEVGRLSAQITASILRDRPEMVEPRFAKVESSVTYANPPLAQTLGIELPDALVRSAAEVVGGP